MKVSIIIPIYNVEKYLKECLDSVVKQTLDDIEIICVDDGSPDKSGQIIDEYAQKYPTIVPIHKQNGGYASAINAGLEIAKGDYIGIVESDDYCDLKMFELLYNKITEKNADVATGDFYFIDDSINNKLRRLNYSNNVIFDENGYFNLQSSPSIIHKAAYPWKSLYKKSFLDEHNIKMKQDDLGSYQDQPWNAEVLAHAQKIVHVNEPLYYYRLDADGSSTNIGKRSMINYLKRRAQAREILIENNAFTSDVREYFYLSAYYGCEFFFIRIANEFKEEYFNEMKIVMNRAFEDGISFKFFPKAIKKDYFRRLNYSYSKYKIISKIRQIFSIDEFEKHYAIKLFGLKLKINNSKKIFALYNDNNRKHKILEIFGLKISFSMLRVYRFLSFIFDNILPKFNKKIVFNSLPTVTDNPYWMYKYISENHPEYKCYWIIQGKKDKTRNYPPNTYKLFSLKGLFHICTSKYIISNHCNDFVDMVHSKYHRWLNLWHGMPVKTLGYCEKDASKKVLRRYKKLSDNSYQFVTSDLFKTIVLSCFKSEYNKCFITGCPRTDSIFSNENDFRINQYFELNKYKKVIMYAPTYKEANRGKVRDIQSEFNNIFYANDYNHEEFIKILEDNGILFIIKPHPFDEKFYRKNVEPQYALTNNVKLLYNKDLNDENFYLYEMFKFIDLMISDFSSITLDYLILNRPVIYLNNLDDEYKENRGFILEDNYQIFMPGDKVSNYIQLMAAIANNLTKNNNKAQREAVLPVIHKYCDNKAAARIFEIMKGLK